MFKLTYGTPNLATTGKTSTNQIYIKTFYSRYDYY